LRFRPDIDLMDETLREGAERATVPPGINAKADLAQAIATIGVRTLVVGMFPDVPHNIELLRELVKRQRAGNIPSDVRFMIISHVGEAFTRTLETLESAGIPTATIWIIAIHSVSDLQIRHLFPTVLRMAKDANIEEAFWLKSDAEAVRAANLQWLDSFLPTVKRYRGGGIMVGLLDTFRADHGHLLNAVDLLSKHGIREVRLVDAAGTCLPHQLPQTVGELVSRFPDIAFYGHFHDDFGMATSNAVTGLALGLRGVDTSVGGFANRAGHPPLAEVVMALRKLYGVALPGFDTTQLYGLSRLTEQLYGLMESPSQAVTGVITHGILTGIRTELHRRAPTIFDIFDPEEVGNRLLKVYGVRSGCDGLARFIRETGMLDDGARAQDVADALYPHLEAEWQRRNAEIHTRLRSYIDAYHKALRDSNFLESEVSDWLRTKLADPQLLERQA